jgi:hypothetical protein
MYLPPNLVIDDQVAIFPIDRDHEHDQDDVILIQNSRKPETHESRSFGFTKATGKNRGNSAAVRDTRPL